MEVWEHAYQGMTCGMIVKKSGNISGNSLQGGWGGGEEKEEKSGST